MRISGRMLPTGCPADGRAGMEKADFRIGRKATAATVSPAGLGAAKEAVFPMDSLALTDSLTGGRALTEFPTDNRMQTDSLTGSLAPTGLLKGNLELTDSLTGNREPTDSLICRKGLISEI